MPICAVIFDIGGVLNRVQGIGAPGRWQTRLGLSDQELAYAIFDGPVTLAASLGQASPQDVWSSVAQRLGLSPAEMAELEDDAWSAYVWNTELLDFVRSLRPRYKTATLSDAWPDARERCKDHINSNVFDVMVFSAEEGIKKPNSDMYRRALEHLGVAAQEAIFVDDKQRNVDAATALGLHGVVYTNNAPCCAEIKRLLGE